MKRFILSILFTSTLSFAQEKPVPNVPVIFFEYARLYDNIVCPNAFDPAWSQEATELEPHFKEVWEKESPLFWSTLFSKFPYGFSRKEYTGTLSVCSKSPSYSNPLVFNITRLLKSFVKEKPLWEDYKFADLVFHEMIHNWLMENFVYQTPLMEKYKNENSGVKNHFHLMGIQAWVYSKLERKDLSEWIDFRYQQMPPDYQRAWQIVKEEGFEKVINDLIPKHP
ncbi:MAG: hypothetical protein ACOYL6_16800 [Bacteriovoracaceae bacterium]